MRIKNKRITIRKGALFVIGIFIGMGILSYIAGRVAYHFDPGVDVNEMILPPTGAYALVGFFYLLVGVLVLALVVVVLSGLFHFLFEVEEVDQ